MSEYTSITNGLRGSMKRVQAFGSPFVQKEAIYFDQMCDAIDSVHAQLERENAELKAELDRARGEWDFWESTHVELPKDADGVPIRIGDVMDFSKNVRNLTVLGIGMVDESECNWGVFVREGSDYVWYNAKFLRHHKPDTWASIIEDAIGDRIEDRAEFDKELDALVARCKALAGDAE